MLAAVLFDLTQVEKIVTFLVMLSVLVVLHEFGHFLMARRSGVRVNEFAVGFGPKLLRWTSPRTRTTYALNLLPIGGYCAMQGEDGKSTEAEQQRQARADGTVEADPENFQSKSAFVRLGIVLAGPLANFILTFALLFLAAFAFGVASRQQQSIVGPLMEGMPAQRAGVQVGDRILALDGQPVRSGDDLVNVIHRSQGKPLRITFERSGTTFIRTLVPVGCPAPNPPHQGCIGFQPIPRYERVGFVTAVSYAGAAMVDMVQQSVQRLALIAMHPAQYAGSLTGVIGMGRAAATIQDFGWAPYIDLAAMISLSLGILNLLPFPALDGGRAAFIVAETLRGKPVDPEKEALVHVAGFAMLMMLMIFVAYHDIAKIVQGKAVF